MANINAPVIPNAVMLDRVIGEIQQGLVDNIPWLNAAFGRSQRLTKMIQGKRVITPNVFCGAWRGHGHNDYIEVSPDSKIGNFAFFEVEDPQTIDAGPWARQIKAPFSLIVWFNLTRVYGEASNRDTEYLKAQILHVLNGRAGWHLDNGRIVINRIYERAENIYRGYSLSEIDNQFLMHPFAGFRFEGLLEFNELCIDDVSPSKPTKTMAIDWLISEEFANIRIKRIFGKSAIIDGVLTNNVTETLQSIGPCLFDYRNTVAGYWQPDHGEYYFVESETWISTQVFPIPKAEKFYIKCPAGLAPYIRIDACGKEDNAIQFQIVPNSVFDMDANIRRDCDKMYIRIYREHAQRLKDVCLYLSHPALDGKYYAWREDVLNLDIPQIQGRNDSGVSIVFADGLKSCGDVCDEIADNKAIKRIGSRPYEPGDENNVNVLTDGTTTNYPLAVPVIYDIVPLPDTMAIAINGYIRRFPEDDNTQLIIEYQD